MSRGEPSAGGCSQSFVFHPLVPFIHSFKEAYPDIELELTSNEGFVDLIEKRTDGAIRIGRNGFNFACPAAGKEPALRKVSLTEEGQDFLPHAEEVLASAEAACASVGAGSAYQQLKNGELVQVLEDYPLISDSAIWAVYPSLRLLAPKVRAFIDYYAEQYQSPPYWDR